VSAKPETPRRRSRQEVETAVRQALLRLLSEGIPFKNLTVDELARAAGLSRTAFYFYFPGKEQALMSAASEVTAELFERADTWWHGEGPPEELVRAALRGILQVYVDHAPLLRAAFELSSYSPEFEAFYKGLLDRFVRATSEHLRREQAAGRLRPVDCDVTAESLVWMAERSNHVLIKQGRSAEELVEAMTSIWVHALYPDSEVSPASG
jgi:TetR/AcrR family transcriptional regulator, ethionamide resistance regulator